MVNAAERPPPLAQSARYDRYDLRHPMWTDPFWDRYCRQPLASVGSVGPVFHPIDTDRPRYQPGIGD